MELTKTIWTKEDKVSFLSYLETFEIKDKIDWTRRILNTNLRLMAIPSKILDKITKEIYKGNYISFLDLSIFDTYESIVIYGKLLTKIKDFDMMLHYLSFYKEIMENWAHVDILSFQINTHNKQKFIELSKIYLTNSKPFIRRLSLMILFQMVKDEEVLPIIFKTLESLPNEDEYYVIMMAGWLLSEAIIKHKDQTLSFIKNSSDLNVKILNKGIQKCRESNRLTQQQKDDLLIYKRKK